MSSNNLYFDVVKPELLISEIIKQEVYYQDKSLPEDMLNIPDVLILSGDKSIGVDDIRVVVSKITTYPTILEHKYIICYETHLLTEASQNALLKHLEQNISYLHWHFFIHSKFEMNILTTLKSRFVKHYGSELASLDDEKQNMYVDAIKKNQLCHEATIDLDILFNAIMSLYYSATNKQQQGYWLKTIDRLIKVKFFEKNYLKWSTSTKIAMIFSDLAL